MKSKPYLPLFASTAMLSASAVLSLTLSLGGSAQAANFTWDGTGNWTDSNWSPGSVTGPTASTDTATINSGSVTITSLAIDSAISIATGATLEANAQENTSNVVLRGNLTGSGILNKTGGWSLVLSGDNSGFSGTINASASNTFFEADSAGSAAADWVLSANTNVTNNQSGTGHVIQLGSLAGTGGYLGNNVAGSAVTFEIGGNGKSTSFDGQIVDTPPGWGGGTTAIAKVGAGELIFNGPVDHTNVQEISTVVVNNGLIRTDNYGKWNSNLNLTVNGSGKFEMWNNESVSLANLSGNGTVQNTKYWGRSQTLTIAAGSFSGTITDLGITSGEGFGFGNTAINLVKSGSGSLTLSGTNSYTGNTTVNEGTLILGNGTNNISLADSADVSIDSDATLQLNYLVGNTDTIDELWLGGVQKSPGVYGSGNSGGLITGTGTLTVTNGPTGSDYNTWGAPYGLTAGSEDGDLDNDGLTNQEEHAFGMIPNSGSSVNPITAQLNKSTGQFSYQRRDNALTGLAYTVWYSTDLSVWTQDTGVSQPEGTPDGNGVETITATLSSLPGNPLPAKLFIQVRAN